MSASRRVAYALAAIAVVFGALLACSLKGVLDARRADGQARAMGAARGLAGSALGAGPRRPEAWPVPRAFSAVVSVGRGAAVAMVRGPFDASLVPLPQVRCRAACDAFVASADGRGWLVDSADTALREGVALRRDGSRWSPLR